MASDQDRKQFLEMYAKMNPSDAAAEEMNNKLKWDIIRKYHEPISKLTQVKTGKYAGQWHTYMKGVDGTAPRQYKRFKTFDDAYQFIVSYYSVQSLTLESYFPHWLEWKCRYHNNKAAAKEHNQNAFKKFLLGTKLFALGLSNGRKNCQSGGSLRPAEHEKTSETQRFRGLCVRVGTGT